MPVRSTGRLTARRARNAFVLALVLRTAEFLFYHLLLAVNRVSRLPRDTTIPEAMRLYRENIALKAQLDGRAATR